MKHSDLVVSFCPHSGLHEMAYHLHTYIHTDYEKAIELYSEAINGYPPSCEQELAVCHANRAACHMKLVSGENLVMR